MKSHSLALLLPLVLLTQCGEKQTAGTREKPETLVEAFDESEMDAAIAKARATVDEFIEVLAERDADQFSIKAPITDSNGTEHFWITNISYENGTFSGKIANDPGIVEKVQFGDSWTVTEDGISDWMYVRGEKIHGGYTIDPLLDSYSEEEAQKMREKLVR